MVSTLTVNKEEGYIDQDRIVNDDFLLPGEYFCPLCGYLLWKPCSCFSCQNLFCRKCIRTWLKENPTSCPFRCASFEEKRAPPYIQSILGRLRIRCRNNLFGCKEIIAYDLLEQHEQVHCQFRTKRCDLCEQLVLLDQFDKHSSLCKPTIVQCKLCQCAIETRLLENHSQHCLQENLSNLFLQNMPMQNELNYANPTGQTPIAENAFVAWFQQCIEEGSRSPTINLPGIQAVFQARQQGWLYQNLTMFLLVLRNPTTAPHILLMLLWVGFFTTVFSFMIHASLILWNWMKTSVYYGCALIMAFSALVTFGLPLLLQMSSDTTLIICVSLIFILRGIKNPYIRLDELEMRETSTALSMLYLASFLLMKLFILIVRLYVYCVPPYLTAACLAWIIIFVTFHLRRWFNPVPAVVPAVFQ
ncbi:unnamed protein product [Rotaria sp. Silwood2]|nr:unnamed protein product [Rotaria sp. Silwood2]CAF4266972.1 unnamed protein product [Rotaria sp. Silwood2]